MEHAHMHMLAFWIPTVLGLYSYTVKYKTACLYLPSESLQSIGKTSTCLLCIHYVPWTLLSIWGIFFFLMKRYKAYYNAFKELAVLKERWIKTVVFIGEIRNLFIYGVLPGATWAILSTFVCLPMFLVHVKLHFCSLNWRFLWGATTSWSCIWYILGLLFRLYYEQYHIWIMMAI